VAWVCLSLSLAFTFGYLEKWFNRRVYMLAEFRLAREPALCGVLFYGEGWHDTGGYAHLHRNVPLYLLQRSSGAVRDRAAAYNAILARRPAMQDLPPHFTPGACFSAPREEDLCVLMRAGGCTSVDDIEINATLRRNGQ
jgi:hypothetical protein